MDCHFLPQGIFLHQGLNLRLLHWLVDSLPLSHLHSDGRLEWQLLKLQGKGPRPEKARCGLTRCLCQSGGGPAKFMPLESNSRNKRRIASDRLGKGLLGGYYSGEVWSLEWQH